ncbi:hypothetical protein BdWA1_003244 [Babesia duncani]|uniref:Uncharacterized protein n=1 Tax=Babesia duncani TaxID=323732 RepID=A0AAD9UNA8_9APIC|nr:hypothetical protein BdWA1_003244 [Babesia duncani]
MLCICVHDLYIDDNPVFTINDYATPLKKYRPCWQYSPPKASRNIGWRNVNGTSDFLGSCHFSPDQVVDINIFKNDKGPVYRNSINPFTVLFFSLENGSYIGKVQSDAFLNKVDILSTNYDMSIIACGDDKGRVSIITTRHQFNQSC